MKKTAAAKAKWHDLLQVMQNVPELRREHDLLIALPPSAKSGVPAGTATRAGAWSTYETAIKAAAVWFARVAAGQKVHERGLAVDAFGDSKGWTDAGRLAFQNLVGKPFSQAVQVPDTPIRLRGPMVWSYQDVICDAAGARPWIDVPARGVQSYGTLVGSPEGILLVENQENFGRVCEETSVPDRWLCVWIQGFASKGLVAFVRRLEGIRLAAWCDLDPPGIKIVKNLMDETGREVHPVGMDPDLWTNAVKLREPDEARDGWRKDAATLIRDGPPALRELATRIAKTGERVEQEGSTVCDQVLPELAKRLKVP
jgi:hypothetical protein